MAKKCPFLSTYLDCYAGGSATAECYHEHFHNNCEHKQKHGENLKDHLSEDIHNFISSLQTRRTTHRQDKDVLEELFIDNKMPPTSYTDAEERVHSFFSSLQSRGINKEKMKTTHYKANEGIKAFLIRNFTQIPENSIKSFMQKLEARKLSRKIPEAARRESLGLSINT